MLESSLVLARCSDLKYEHMLVLTRARGFNARTRSVLGILMLDPSLLIRFQIQSLELSSIRTRYYEISMYKDKIIDILLYLIPSTLIGKVDNNNIMMMIRTKSNNILIIQFHILIVLTRFVYFHCDVLTPKDDFSCNVQGLCQVGIS